MNRKPIFVPFDFLDDLVEGSFQSVPKTFADHLWRIVRRLPREFSLRDAYRSGALLQRAFRDNHSIDATIRGTLQRFRDSKWIEFLGRGRYRRVRG